MLQGRTGAQEMVVGTLGCKDRELCILTGSVSEFTVFSHIIEVRKPSQLAGLIRVTLG